MTNPSASGEPFHFTYRGDIVSNTDDIKGRVKEAAGDLTDNDELKNEGKTDQAAGKAKEIADNVKDKFDDTVDAVKDKLQRD
jgi:uncharacterized protein YjbJ (UPF0337 family)